MKKITGVVLAAVMLLSFLLSECTTADNTVKASLGTQFTLAVGQTANISSANMKVKFVDVTGDSRCASDVVCIWAGQVACLVNFTINDADSSLTLTQTGGAVTTQQVGAYTCTFNVAPYPVSTHKIEKNEYRLQLTITK
jgi:hypothetical protein